MNTKLLYSKYLKRFFDIIFSSTGLIILSPLMIVIIFLIILSMGRPVFFVQVRPGKSTKLFKLYKFRTMKTINNGLIKPDSERITKLGLILRKFSLDELPELYNILIGDMSFVGPRPLLKKYLPFYTYEENKRHDVRPGLTGLAQVNGRNLVEWEKRFDYDLYYVNNQSFIVDLKILLLTMIKIFKFNDIAAVDHIDLKDLDDERSY